MPHRTLEQSLLVLPAAALLALWGFAATPQEPTPAIKAPAEVGAREQTPALDPTTVEELLGHAFEFGSEEQARGAVQEATRAGQLERAREILGDLLVLDYQRQISALLAAGDPATALPLIKRSLAIAPRAPGLLRERAEALLDLAERSARTGASGIFVQSAFEDALRAFDQGPENARSLFGKSRALYWLNRSSESFQAAERAAVLLRQLEADWDSNDGALGELQPALLERYPFGAAQELLAEAAYLRFADLARFEIDATQEADTARSDQAYVRALAEADAALGVAPQEPGNWLRLANIELFRGAARNDPKRTDAALQALARGLDFVPDDQRLLAKLTEVAGQAGGPGLTRRELEAALLRFPDGLRTRFELGKALFLQAEQLAPADGQDPAANETAREQLRRARADFADIAERATSGDTVDAELARSSTGWQVITQASLGWISLREGDSSRAQGEFLATEDILPGGLRWRWEGLVESAEQGLALLVSRYAGAEELERAAELSAILAERIPDSPDYANNAGFFARDLAMEHEALSARLCAAARGAALKGPDGQALEGAAVEEALGLLRRAAGVAPELFGTEAEKRLFRERSGAERESALAWIQRSGQHYLAAAALIPDDVRVINDTALVFVHYLHAQLEQAETLLLHAAEIGAAQLADSTLDEGARLALTEAWGDAFYNLGVMYLDHKNQPERARFYFERSLEIGPPGVDRLNRVRNYFLPRCDGSLEVGPDGTVLAWGQPCDS